MKVKIFLKSTVSLSLVAMMFYGTSSFAAAPSAPIVTQNAVQVEKTVSPAVPFDPVAPAQVEKGKTVNFTLEAKRAKLEIAPGQTREVWTFNGQVPAPTLRVNQGDTVHFTLVNKDPDMEHGLDFHAGQMDMGTFHKPIKPGESVSFDWAANYPGVFYYHCSANPVIAHIANGMFGAVIVDPPGYKPSGKEYVLIQHEWYKDGADLDEFINGKPEALAFNGVPSQYATNPLLADPGENVRFYFVNAGINNFSAFHVIGTIFDKVLLDGNPQNTLHGVQTVAVPPGGALVTDLVADTGTYAILTHSMKDAMKGALGILKVGDQPVAQEGMSHGNSGSSATSSSASLSAPSLQADADDAAATTIHMANFAYSPKSATVKAGSKVTWLNDEATLHTVVSDTFDSRTEKKDGFNKGERYSHLFTAPGIYKIRCTLHPFMTGTVTVK